MKTTLEYSTQLLTKWGLTLTSEYTGAHKPVQFTCANGHSNTGAATNILQRGYKCKECIAGYKVIPKIKWTDTLKLQVVTALATESTAVVAKAFNTTESAINNMLAESNISNSASRLSNIKLLEVLSIQGRELISVSGDFAKIRCSEGHIHTHSPSNILQHSVGCPSCFSAHGVSSVELQLLGYIRSKYTGWIICKDRTFLAGKEIDILLPDLGLAIELNGTYWHSEDKVGIQYHKNKSDDIEAYEYQLLHIKDYDWINKNSIVKNIIDTKLGLNTRIFARKCEVRSIGFPSEFLNRYHIQGAGQPTSTNLGLYYNDELVFVATFGAARFGNIADYELMRCCSKSGVSVVGGLSKLLKRIQGSIVSYASRDYSIGNAYTKVGFQLVKVTQPGLEYYKHNHKISRYAAQSMTTEQLKGYHKYYNSGNLLFFRPTYKVM